jgi:hypothetical protein
MMEFHEEIGRQQPKKGCRQTMMTVVMISYYGPQGRAPPLHPTPPHPTPPPKPMEKLGFSKAWNFLYVKIQKLL